jgi:DNA-binding transcriptional LysR family regulator
MTMFHARILRYLDEVVRSGSIRKAADKLNVASSSVNRQILELEQNLKTPIFERLPRGLRLTAAGEMLITHVRQTLRDHDRLQSRILELRGLTRGTIKIATMHGLASGLIPRLATDFRRKYPGIRIVVQTLVGDEIVRAVDEADADFGLGHNLRSDPGIHVVEVFDARVGAIVSPDHPLASRPHVRLMDCANHSIVLADPSISIHNMMRNAFRRSNLSLESAYETNSVELMKYLAIHDNAIVFLSAPDVSEEIRTGKVVYLPIMDRSLKNHPLSLIQRTSSSLGLAPGLFSEMLREELRQLTAAR